MTESAPDGGHHSLRLFSDARRRGPRTSAQFRWDPPWTATGPFRPAVGEDGEPPGYRLAHNINLAGGQVSIRVEGRSPDDRVTNAKLTGELPDGETEQISADWGPDVWHRYRVPHDGESGYRLSFWNASEASEQAESVTAAGESPWTRSQPLGYFFHSGEPQAVHHAYIDYRTTGR